MDPPDNLQHDGHRQQQHTFANEGWAIGNPPSFEVDLAAFDGNDPAEVMKCAKVIQQVRADDETLYGIESYSPKLYHRIFEEDATQLITGLESGITAASLRFVIRNLTGIIDIPTNKQHNSSDFLRWLTQICITIWAYKCNRGAFGDLQRSAQAIILADGFQSFENDAAFLTIIAFVLGGSLDDRLPEYVDAVVWFSRVEFASTIAPLRRLIIRERQALLELIFSRFSQVLAGLAHSHDAQLKALGERLHERFENLTQSQLDFSRPFAHFQHLECARYPEILQRTFFRALRAELRTLRDRTQSFGSNHSAASSPALNYQGSTRDGAGLAGIKRMIKDMKTSLSKSKQTSPLTPESVASRLQLIIEESRLVILEQRSRVRIAVQELIAERDGRVEAGSSAGEESDPLVGNGSSRGSST